MKNSIHNIPEVIKLIIIYSLINIGIIYYIFTYLKNDINVFIFISSIILLFYFVFIILPVIILYNNYTSKTKNIFLVLKDDSLIINDKTIYINDIKNITINGTYQHFKGLGSGGVSTLPYNDSFFFLQIYVDNQVYYISSLLSYDLDIILMKKYPNINYDKKINSFPLIK
ncbi:hypothetical protein ACNFNZ_08120 [Empedobacter brevis]|uniref:hypothetical protein n=1 Tax=Empedobacter brevis TaxID=247 RepID=UPI0023F11172|nr:hypothetical protein [Empedobacter brevis]